eukprot:CAMPEP_0115108686 /NCGR_PEP_ID=MMETSP0227-20121206/38157_1 /TAXON_ID=89957 /ORGANISM="Polarella glacialis, Strain CCMP 1383" /LENGTH=31 /DNA_ID= /DNA_START= /DNA_END= /DNA_ORIENTATION=
MNAVSSGRKGKDSSSLPDKGESGFSDEAESD